LRRLLLAGYDRIMTLANDPRAGSPAVLGPEDDPGAPYPLQRRFYIRVLPGIVLFVAGLVATTIFAARTVTEQIYLRLATERAAGVAEGVRQAVPAAWERLLSGAVLTAEDREALVAAFAEEQREFNLVDLKVYDTARRTIYAADPAKIGTVESGAALLKVVSQQRPSAVPHRESADGPLLYELYVPYFSGGRVAAVIELYEPAEQLDEILYQVGWPMALVLLAFLTTLVTSLAVLVRAAQADIDGRTRTISRLRQRLERLVSRQAVSAVRAAGEGPGLPTQALDLTLFYSDARDFTGFSERHAPEEVIAALNRLMALQVEIIQGLGGDVDKMIGDAVFARFDKTGRERRALEAAAAVQRAIGGKGGVPFGVGIGVYSGRVVAGSIGGPGRLDYTVVGDSVNVAARLCSLARAGEVVADAATVEAAELDGFGPVETVTVKGRRQSLAVRRLSLALPVAPAASPTPESHQR
jgi:adenylate cyclase